MKKVFALTLILSMASMIGIFLISNDVFGDGTPPSPIQNCMCQTNDCLQRMEDACTFDLMGFIFKGSHCADEICVESYQIFCEFDPPGKRTYYTCYDDCGQCGDGGET